MKWRLQLLIVFLLGGCATGDDPVKPQAGMAENSGNPALLDSYEQLPQEEQWWLVFKDQTLDQWMKQTLQGSHDLAQAMARIDEARAVARRAGVELSPTASVNASAARVRNSETVPNMPGNTNASRYRATIDVSYEVDLWNRLKHLKAAAYYDARQREADFAAVRLVLTAEVADTYYSMQGLEIEKHILAETRRLRGESVDLLKTRVTSGLANELDFVRAQAELASIDAELERVARLVALQSNRLLELSGNNHPGSVQSNEPVDFPIELPNIMPGELLQRRPDIVSMELAWEAAAERIGVAHASFFPRINLMASGGLESAQLDDLLDVHSIVYSLVAGLTAPLFDGGKNQANLDIARAQAIQVGEAYAQQIRIAYREWMDARTNYQGLSAQQIAVQRTLAASADAVALSRERYDHGLVSYLEVIEAERQYLEAQRTLQQLATQKRLAMVACMRALGGAWMELSSQN